MTVTSARDAVIGFGRQTADSGETPLTVPAFEIPMGSGFAGPERSVQELPWTNESQDSVGDYVERVSGVISCTIPVLPVSAGSILEAILGARSTSAGPPYTHTFTPDDDLDLYTWFYAQPGNNYWTVDDVKLNEWELSWAPGSPLEASVTGMGKNVTRSGSKWGSATLEESVDPFFTYIGSTVKFEAATTPAATTVHNIAGGSISVGRNVDAIQTDALTYGHLVPNKRDIAVSLDDVVFEDNDLINTIFTGTTSGTALSGAVVYGSYSILFLGSDQAASSSRSLTITLPRVLWTIDQVPGADPGGQTLRYTVTGKASKPSSGASITAALVNGSAGTVY